MAHTQEDRQTTTGMTLQYCSDLHLEFMDNHYHLHNDPLTPSASVLILAGDIIPFAHLETKSEFIDYFSDRFEKTYWLPGNHEYYRYDVAEKQGPFCEALRPNVFLVNNHVAIESGVRLIFSTLWSRIHKDHERFIENRMNDFRLIKYNGDVLRAKHYNQLHRESLDFLENEFEKTDYEKTAVITHHVPTFINYPEQYRGEILNYGFATELKDLVEKSKADCWIYGHSHCNTPEFAIGKTRMLTNQLGYVRYGEHLSFDRTATVTL